MCDKCHQTHEPILQDVFHAHSRLHDKCAERCLADYIQGIYEDREDIFLCPCSACALMCVPAPRALRSCHQIAGHYSLQAFGILCLMTQTKWMPDIQAEMQLAMAPFEKNKGTFYFDFYVKDYLVVGDSVDVVKVFNTVVLNILDCLLYKNFVEHFVSNVELLKICQLADDNNKLAAHQDNLVLHLIAICLDLRDQNQTLTTGVIRHTVQQLINKYIFS
jgi:hypothetical protein